MKKVLILTALREALMRACQLVEQLGAGEVIKTYIDCDHCDKSHREVEFDSKWINDFLWNRYSPKPI